MRTKSTSTFLARTARRFGVASTVGALLFLATPLAAGATSLSPTIDSVTSGNSSVTANWTLNVSDATGVNVILYDNGGAVVQNDTVSPSSTVDTFANVPDGTGYYVVVTATDPSGTVSSTPSTSVDVAAYVSPTITSITATGGNVTITWSAGSPTSSTTVTLTDANGATVATYTSPDNSVTSVTFNSVADGGGYVVSVEATTPSGDVLRNDSAMFDITGGAYVLDNPPVISTVNANNGDVTVTWTNDAADASGINVSLYDVNGVIIASQELDSSATSATFANVADGQGYTIVVSAHTPSGDLSSLSSAPFTLFNGAYTTDNAPTITDFSCATGSLTVNWLSNATDVTGYEVVLLNADGTVASDALLPADALSFTFANVLDGAGYTIEVIAQTPFGTFNATSSSFTISNGSITQIPVDPPILLPGTTIVVDPSVVTVVHSADGTWTVSWPDVANSSTNGQYLVTSDQGYTCDVSGSGVAQTVVSCSLSVPPSISSEPTGIVVTYYPEGYFVPLMYGVDYMAGPSGSVVSTFHGPIERKVAKDVATTPRPVIAVALVASPVQAQETPWIVGGSFAVLGLAALAMVLRRRTISSR